MGLTDGHLAWGDDIPTESEKTYYRQIDNLEKENARLLEDCEAYKKAIEDIKAELKEVGYCKDEYGDIRADVLTVRQVIDIIDNHTSGKEGKK